MKSSCSNCSMAECFPKKSSWCWNEQVFHMGLSYAVKLLLLLYYVYLTNVHIPAVCCLTVGGQRQRWKIQLKNNKFEHLNTVLRVKEIGVGNMVQQAHLSSMRKVFHSYFPDLSELDPKPIPNPFIMEVRFLLESMQDD